MRRNSNQQNLSEGIIPKNDLNNKLGSAGSPDSILAETLSYLNQILLEEDIDENDIPYTEESALYAMEKPFYDILGQKYPSSVENPQLINHTISGTGSTDHHYLYQLSSNFGTLSASEFNKGVEEGNRFLPSIDKLDLELEAKKLSLPLLPEEDDLVKLNSEIDGNNNNEDFMGCGSTGKKKSNIDLDLLEGRNRKISMSYSEEPPRNEMFDEVLLEYGNLEVANLPESIKNKTNKYLETDQVGIVDVTALLIECSHAVYANDRQLAEGLLNQIRKQSSLDGDGTQRMASVFADALEARLNGTGSEAWRRIAAKRIPTSEYLKITRLYITVCPFPRISIYYANQTILNVAKKASKLHIIDFGISFGFQWPSLIHALSNNKNSNSIKLRITGIDFPLQGFRPAELIQETGRRLEAYAESFGVPFEYHGIASNWEDVSPNDLNIEEDEVVIVNSLYRFNEIGDEAVSLDNSPRNRVFDLIRRIRPHVFIEGVVSIGAFSPFFISRFKQGLLLYSALFEILDTLIPPDNKQRQFVERHVLARDILNVFACEGSDWIVKPETHKQWHQRNLRAGLEQIPLDPGLVRECKEQMKKVYHNNIFFIEEDKNWLLQGWSGRTFYALSTWRAKLA